MATFDLNVEDSSPLFSYSPVGAWTDSPDGDSLVSSYSGSSLHTTAAQGATATINFNGTGISLFGAKRPNYGTYTISVDGKVITNGNAQSDTPAFNQLLGEVKGLSSGEHTAVLTNTGSGASLDIDFVQLHDQIGSAGDKLMTTTIDDTDPRIQLGPSASSWDVNNSSAFMNSTLHFSSDPNAVVSMEFAGDAIAIYGTVAPDHADVKIQIDGQSVNVNGGTGVSRLYTQTLLYYANNLGPQQHELVMTSVPRAGSPYIDLDSISVYSAPSGISSGASMNGNSTANNQSGTNTPASATHTGAKSTSNANAALIGSAVAAAVAFIALLAALFYVLRRRRARSRKNWSPITPELPIQVPEIVEYGLGSGFRSVPITPNRASLTKKSPKFFPGSRLSKSYSPENTSPTASIAPLVMPSVPPESRTRNSPGVSQFAARDFLVPETSTNQPSLVAPTSKAQTRKRDVVSTFTISDYAPPTSSNIPPMPPIPEQTHSRQPRDNVSRFTISDYSDSDNAKSPSSKRRPPTLKIPGRR